ncbi:MAG TPA: ATP-binding protein [Gammaproteobacteria bacterium]
MGLFWKIFVSFGIAMAVTIYGTVHVSFLLARQEFDQLNVQGRERILQEVSEALRTGGEHGLKSWLLEHPRPAPGTVLLVLDENGREIVGRATPRELMRLLMTRPFRPTGKPPPNLRPIQLAPHLIGADGKEYRLFFTRAPLTFLGILTWPGTRIAVLTIALLTATLTSLLLARYLSSPIVRLQRASRALAAGALHTRVGAPVTRRKDEVGKLARDFDTMAERIQALVMDKEALLRDVSHELRSPLARIRVALALAQRRANESAQPDLERIERETERLDELVGRVMTLTRLRTATAPQRAPVKFHDLVSGVVADARFEHPNARIEYDGRSVPRIMGSEADLKSAVENVIRNALIHAESAEPIRVELDATRDAIVLRVLDRGPGVPDQDLKRIFEPFYRADTSRDHRKTGQGIGLAITTRVVELHGGTVTAANRPGGGLAVTLRLPLQPAPAVGSEAVAPLLVQH